MNVIRLTGRIFRDGGQFVCHCNELDDMTCGRTLDEVVMAARDMVESYFEACHRLGTMTGTLARLLPGHSIASPSDLGGGEVT